MILRILGYMPNVSATHNILRKDFVYTDIAGKANPDHKYF